MSQCLSEQNLQPYQQAASRVDFIVERFYRKAHRQKWTNILPLILVPQFQIQISTNMGSIKPWQKKNQTNKQTTEQLTEWLACQNCEC